MKGMAIIQVILILVILLAIAALSLPWAIDNVKTSMDLTEVKSVGPQFADCNSRIIETARTGSTNKCIFSVKQGQISGRADGIYYRILSNAPICDKSDLAEIDTRNHIWQECNVSGKQRSYGLLWKFPSTLNVTGEGIEGNQLSGQTSVSDINFGPTSDFDTLTLFVNFQYTVGQIGNVVELSRIDVTQTNVTLRVKIS
jgi:hypothetical protein